MAGRITRLWYASRSRISKIYTHIKKDIQKRPFVNFYMALFVFVAIIALSSILQRPAQTEEAKSPAKEVSLYSIGSAPRVKVSAQIEKTGVIEIVALSGGVVQKVNYHEGDKASKGSVLFNLSTNYQGGNAMSTQRQLAGNQYNSAVETFDLQKDIISNQRDIATKSAENSDKMRDIMNSSRESTRNLIKVNEALLKSLDDELNGSLEVNDTTKVMLQTKAQLLAGLAQAQASLASADYQADTDRPPAQLAVLQKDLTLKTLDLQEKMLGVNKEAARLQLQLAQITEALMYPSAPVNGLIQRIFVHEGDVVNPGQQLAVIAQSAEEDPVTAIAYVPQAIASKISKLEESTLFLNGKTLKEFPYFISSEAVSGNSYAVYYAVPDDLGASLTDKGYIDIEIPVGYAATTTAVTYVPVDSIYQTDTGAYLFVNQNNTAKNRKIELGSVYGEYVAVNKGLKDGDQVILTRNVVDGDKIQISK